MSNNGSVPVIDFGCGRDILTGQSEPWIPSPEQQRLADEIIQAFRTVGFVCLVNTSVTQQQIDDMIGEVKKFFQRSAEYKSAYTKAVLSNTGWTAVARENLNPSVRKTGDFKETFNYQPNMRREELPEAMQVLDRWWESGSRLAAQVMRLMGLGLGLKDPAAIGSFHSFGSHDNESAIRVNFYPKTFGQDLAEDQVRCSEHTDYGSITLLVQDSRGLEVMNRQTGSFEAVEAPPGGVVVNIGDMMQRWTSDDLAANLHRVLVAQDPAEQKEDRVSVPFFAMPDQSTVIRCLLGRDKYEQVVMSDWLKMKIDLAFKERQGSAAS